MREAVAIEGVSIPLHLIRELWEACGEVDEARRLHARAQQDLAAASRRFEDARGRKLRASDAIERAAHEAREVRA